MLSDGPFRLHVIGKGLVTIDKDGSVSTDQPHLAITQTKQDIFIDTQCPDIELSDEEEEEQDESSERRKGPVNGRPLKRPCLQSTEDGHLIRKSYLCLGVVRAIYASGDVRLKITPENTAFGDNPLCISAREAAQVTLFGYPRVSALQLKARDGAVIKARISSSNGKYVPPMVDVSARGAASVDLGGGLPAVCLNVKGEAEVEIQEVCKALSGTIGGMATVNICVLHRKPKNVFRGKGAYLLYELYDDDY